VTTPARSEGLVAGTPWSLRWLYLAIGAWTAAIGPFAAVILKAHGFDPAVIGLLSAAAAVTATLVGPALGHLGDAVIGRTAAYRVALTIAGGAAVVLLLPIPAWLFAPVVTSFAVFVGPFLALSDSLAMGALASPERQYGAVRSLASLAFAIGVVIAGLIYDQAGYAAVPLVGLAWTVAVWLIVGQVPDRTRDRANRLEQRASEVPHDGRFGSISRAFAAEPRLYLLLPALTLLWAGIEGAILFVGIRIVDLGGEPSAVGLSFGMSAIFEIPGLLVVGWLSRRIGLPALLLLASLAFGLCVLTWALLSDPSAIIATRVATGLGYGALVGGSVLVIARLLPLELQSTGQALMVAASVGLGTVFGSIIGGLIYETLGATTFFVAAGSMTIAGGGLVFATLVSTPSSLRAG
jgi:MFS transporter, PPP family, 3-phenylpropionic acid transporter